MVGGFFDEKGGVGVVEEVIEEVVGSEELIGNIGRLMGFGIDREGCGVENEVVLLDDLRCNLLVSNGDVIVVVG